MVVGGVLLGRLHDEVAREGQQAARDHVADDRLGFKGPRVALPEVLAAAAPPPRPL